MMERESINS